MRTFVEYTYGGELCQGYIDGYVLNALQSVCAAVVCHGDIHVVGVSTLKVIHNLA